MPLSKVTDVALVELQVSVADFPRMTVVGCAVSVNVGGLCAGGGGGSDFPPEQAIKVATMSKGARLTTFIRVQFVVGACDGEIVIEVAQPPGDAAGQWMSRLLWLVAKAITLDHSPRSFTIVILRRIAAWGSVGGQENHREFIRRFCPQSELLSSFPGAVTTIHALNGIVMVTAYYYRDFRRVSVSDPSLRLKRPG